MPSFFMRVRIMILKKRGRNMHLEEYNKIKDYTYEEYCEYLKNKYGKVPYKYGSTKNRKPGLFIHHIGEKEFPNLSSSEVIKNTGPKYQEPDMLCYCDYLEHLLLHIMIAEETFDNTFLGLGGASGFLIPALTLFFDYGLVYHKNFKHHCELVQNNELTWEQMKIRYNLIRIKFNEKLPTYYTKQIQQNNLSNALKKYYNSLLTSGEPLWTEEEIKIIKKYYPQGGVQPCQQFLPQRTKSAIKSVAHKLNIPSNHPCAHRWTSEDHIILSEEFPKWGINCPSLLKKEYTKPQIYQQALRNNITTESKMPWVQRLPEEDLLLKKLYKDKHSRTEIIHKFLTEFPNTIHTEGSIKARLKTLRLVQNQTWTKQEQEILREYYPTIGTDCQQFLPQRGREAIKKQAQMLGVKRVYESKTVKKSQNNTNHPTIRYTLYSPEELTLIAQYYPLYGAEYCQKVIKEQFNKDRTISSIRDQAIKKLKLHCHIKYTKEVGFDLDKFQQLYETSGVASCAQEFQLTEEQVRNIAGRHKFKRAPSTIRTGPQPRQIKCIESQRVYPSCKQASKDTGISAHSLQRACQGARKTAGGYHWEYIED